MGCCFGKPSVTENNPPVQPEPQGSLEHRADSLAVDGSAAPPAAIEPKACSLDELKKATDNFNASRSLGRGAFGEVWRGKLSWAPSVGDPQGYNVAVKKLFQEADGQGHALWVREAQQLLTLGSQHSNIVNLLGYLYSENLLVFPLYSRGSLLQALSGTSAGLSWPERVSVALDCARALRFLHSKGIIHRNVKPSNILLDGNCRAHLSDFGLAREGPDGTLSHLSTQMLGDLGYMDPEYYMTSRLTFKSDVYALGVVLVELLAGRHDVTRDLRDWAVSLNAPKSLGAKIDRRLGSEFDKDQALKVLFLAKDCLHQEGSRRPDMNAVVQRIKGLQAGKGVGGEVEALDE